ncbi:MAG: DUF6580 family putative transport protein [Chitinophagaceae bacterium]
MSLNRNHILSFVLLILVASLYRIMPNRPWGFAPQIAMALFAGATVREKKYSFAFPLLSMFLSDLLYQGLFVTGLGTIPGFYEGQFSNYIMLTSLTVIGFFIKSNKPLQITAGAITAPIAYFIISNFEVWIGGGGYHRPKTFAGLMQCYVDGWPFFNASVAATFFFSFILFGGYALLKKNSEMAYPS